MRILIKSTFTSYRYPLLQLRSYAAYTVIAQSFYDISKEEEPLKQCLVHLRGKATKCLTVIIRLILLARSYFFLNIKEPMYFYSNDLLTALNDSDCHFFANLCSHQ